MILFVMLFMHFFVAFYLLMSASLIRTIAAILILSNGINLALFKFSGMKEQADAIIGVDQSVLSLEASDPLPQALILTAIVIGFGFCVLMSFLALRTNEESGADVLDQITVKES
jgi:multicomponent Na+:H+ antiporter subunit C